MDRVKATELQDRIAAYQDILGKDPHSTVFVSLSDAWRRLGMLTEAAGAARQGIQILPEFGPGYVVLARVQLELGELDGAERSLTRALELDPQSAFALEDMARLRLLQGNRDQALTLLEQAVGQASGDPVPANLLRSLRPEASRETGVSQHAPTKAVEEQEAPIVTATVADLYVRQGHLQRAREVYQELLAAHPEDDSLRLRLAAVDEQLAAAEASGEGEVMSDVAQPAAAPGDNATEAVALSAVAEPATPEGPQQAVAVLHRWLEAIQRRREHVQGYSAGHC